jgi:hypothetical protein
MCYMYNFSHGQQIANYQLEGGGGKTLPKHANEALGGVRR